jgi:hypothetical protein
MRRNIWIVAIALVAFWAIALVATAQHHGRHALYRDRL